MRPEEEIEAAIARGDFDDLPGAGRPLDLPQRHDPDWWIRKRLDDGDIDRDALLPVVMLLRREHEEMDSVLAGLVREDLAREHLESYNERVLADRRENPFARMIAPTVDVEKRLAAWREARERIERARRDAEQAERAAHPRSRRRRWWGRVLGR